MIFLRVLLVISLLGNATLVLQEETQPVMFAILGALHITAAIAIVTTSFAKFFSPFMYLPISSLNLLTFAASVSACGLNECAYSILLSLGIICVDLCVRRDV